MVMLMVKALKLCQLLENLQGEHFGDRPKDDKFCNILEDLVDAYKSGIAWLLKKKHYESSDFLVFCRTIKM